MEISFLFNMVIEERIFLKFKIGARFDEDFTGQ